jgi:hypothetical protein
MRSASSPAYTPPAVRPDRPPLSRINGDRRPQPLSLFSLELLQLCAGQQADPAAWRRFVLDVTSRYDNKAIEMRLRELQDGGYITDAGIPRVGWLTLKGKAALARVGHAHR